MSAAEKLFLDTNVLVYAHDRSEVTKGPLARTLLTRILAAGKPFLSMQVLSEFYWAVTRKIVVPLSHDEAAVEIERFYLLSTVVPLTWTILQRALQTTAAHQMALWDSQIFSAAVLHGVTTLLSEDFQHRRTIEGITFINPFAPDFAFADISIP